MGFDSTVPQVRIHNSVGNSKKILSMKRSDLLEYVNRIRMEPKEYQKWDYNPFLAVQDFDTGEEFIYNQEKDIPAESIKNSKGNIILEILPE